MEKRSFKSQWALLMPYLKPYFLPLLCVFVLILFSTACNLLSTRFVGNLIDTALAKSWHEFLIAIRNLASVFLVSIVLSLVQYLLTNNTAEKITFNLRQEITDKLAFVEYKELERRHSGDYISRLSNDLELINGLISAQLPMVFSSIIGAVASLGYLFFLSWRVILVALVVAPVLLLVASALSKPLGQATMKYQEELAGVNALAQDATGGIAVSKAFLLKDYLTARFHRRAVDAAEASVEHGYYQLRLTITMSILNLLPMLVLYGAGGYEVIQGRMLVGDMIVMTGLFSRIMAPLQMLSMAWAQINAALMASERIFEMFELPSERRGGKPLHKTAGYPYAIEMKDVKFSYGKDAVFTGLNLAVSQGETVAIVGPSGAGKSTLLMLLLGLRSPQEGEILCFGQPLAELSLASLRQSIAYVGQESFLFPVSVAENIGYGKENATRAEIKAAAREAYAEEFIVNLPQGYDTQLGELGTGLSGGQKQRLCLARAILKDAPILLLDEATSSLDTEAEAKVQAALERVARGRTTIIVAHRLSTIINADRIFVLDQGRVVEEGTHEELLAAGGTYAALYAAQLETKQVQAAGH